jgi:hypothetical protein
MRTAKKKISIYDEGVLLADDPDFLDFTGGGVTGTFNPSTNSVDEDIPGGSGGIQSIVAGTNISVDDTDPANPIVSSLSDRYKTTSTTSQAIVSTGTLTFTVDANLAYTPQQDVIIAYNASNHMHGHVVSYSGTTLVVDIQHKDGSGTYFSWIINLDGVPVTGGTSWGAITGTLSDQTDLQSALDAKQAAGTYVTGATNPTLTLTGTTLGLNLGNSNIFTETQNTKISNATTNTKTTLSTFGLNSSNTPLAGFGSSINFQLKSSTTNDQDAVRIDTSWVDATHATRKARTTFYVSGTNATGSITRDTLRIESEGTNSVLDNRPNGTVTICGLLSDIYSPAVTPNTGLTIWSYVGSASTPQLRLRAFGSSTNIYFYAAGQNVYTNGNFVTQYGVNVNNDPNMGLSTGAGVLLLKNQVNVMAISGFGGIIGGVRVGGNLTGNAPYFENTTMIIEPAYTTRGALILRNIASQTADIIKFQTSASVDYFAVSASGLITNRLITKQQQWEYDASNYANITVGSTGGVTFDSVGTGASFTFSDKIIAGDVVRLKSYTVATLPTGTEGDTAYVTDATSPTYLGSLTGGGTVKCPVFYNGTAWVSH